MISKNELKFIRSLKIKKYRTFEKCFLVEGEKNVLELLKTDYRIEKLLVTTNFLSKYDTLVSSLPYREVTAKELTHVSSLVTNDQALAVVAMQPFATSNLDLSTQLFALDGIRNSGNLGTIIRTLDWFGYTQLVCSTDTAEVYNPKVISATMGSFLRVKVVYCDLEKFLRNYEGAIVGTTIDGEPMTKFRFKKPSLVVMGSESHGIRPAVTALLDHRITIAKFGKAESLNVGVATGILCHILSLE